MKKEYKADIVIVGAGSAGCLCAIAAARCGLNTILIEQSGLIGGVASTTIMGSFANMMANTRLQKITGGIIEELIERIVILGGTPYSSLNEAVYGKIGEPFTIPFQPVWYMQALSDMLEEAKVTVLLNCMFVSGKQMETEKTILHFSFGTIQISAEAEVVVDATGNAEVAQGLGAVTRTAVNSTYGCLMRIGNVDIEKTLEYIRCTKPWEKDDSYEVWLRETMHLSPKEPLRRLHYLADPLSYDHAPRKNKSDVLMTLDKWSYIERRYQAEGVIYTLELCLLRSLIKDAVRNHDFILDQKVDSIRGVTFNGDGIAYGAWGDGIALCNVAKPYGFLATDAYEVTQAALLARKYNAMMFHFLRKYVTGFENSYLLDMGSQTVARFGRTIIGCDELEQTNNSSLYQQPIYLFGGVGSPEAGVPVPYGKILCSNVRNVFSVGKGSSHGEQYRSQISCMSMGIAAAAAAKIICETKYNSHTMPWKDLEGQLISMGVILQKEEVANK